MQKSVGGETKNTLELMGDMTSYMTWYWVCVLKCAFDEGNMEKEENVCVGGALSVFSALMFDSLLVLNQMLHFPFVFPGI